MQLDWSDEEILPNKTPRNIQNIVRYRESTPVHDLFASMAEQAGIGVGSLRNLYIPVGRRKVSLLVMDPRARGSVPTGVGKRIADALDINAVAVDFSPYSKESMLAQLRSDDNQKTESAYFCLPRYAKGEALLNCENLRAGSKRKLSLKQLADYIMQRLHSEMQSTSFATWKAESRKTLRDHCTSQTRPTNFLKTPLTSLTSTRRR